MSEGKREKILGIDLGTTNSAAAVVMGGNPVIIPSAEGPTVAGKMFPSVVAITKEGDVFCVRGHAAEKLVAMTNLASAESRVYLKKRLARMGIAKALERAGLEVGDIVRFGKNQLEWE